MKRLSFLITIFFSFFISVSVFAYNLRRITNQDGLSNSSVTCLYQDDERYLWIGTYDGLNMYDGRDIEVYKPHAGSHKSLSSNVIKAILETDKDHLWICTKWGLNRLNQRANLIEEHYDQFRNNYHVAKDSHNRLFVIGKDNCLSYYDKEQKKFVDLRLEGVNTTDVWRFYVVQDTLWVLYQGTLRRYTVDFVTNDQPVVTRHKDLGKEGEFYLVFQDGEDLFLVDNKHDLYVYHVVSGQKKWICSLDRMIQSNGVISSMIYDGRDILVAFKTAGVIRLKAAENYAVEKIDIDCGVFSLWKDKKQNIIWIGTDGQGVYMYTQDAYSFHNLTFEQFPVKIKKPVRAICTDPQRNLWLGTKDDGVIMIRNYERLKEITAKDVKHFTTTNGLANNSVFAFSARNPERLWIGSDGPGISYYSYKEQRMDKMPNHTPIGTTYVHAIHESGDSVLWLGTSGNGLLRAKLNADKRYPAIIDMKQFLFAENGRNGSEIYSLAAEGDSVLWLGTRGYGVIRFNMQTGKYAYIGFDVSGVQPMNEVLSVYRGERGRLWLGTSYGFTCVESWQHGQPVFTNWNETNSLPNNTIHGILPDEKGGLWLSSNNGIILYDTLTKTFRNFNYKMGLKVSEFSDNAYYKCPYTGALFFGGVNGLVWIKPEEGVERETETEIYFRKLRIFNQEYPLSEFLRGEGKDAHLELKYNQNFFAVSFAAIDFINGPNCEYSYRLENFSNDWMDTRRSNEAVFTNIAPGRYVLKVKYKNTSGNYGIHDYSLPIVILPPWYLTMAAKIIYVFLFIGCILGLIYIFHLRNERKRRKIIERLQEQHKEEIYEEKLRFFTNITHEFCTPLTLIYGPCERILAYEHTDAFISKYVKLIQANAERLNALIQEVIDFRRIETGNKVCHIERISVTELAENIAGSFMELAERNKVTFEVTVQENLWWNTDSRCLSKIINNLISNAFKYTPQGGEIRIKAGQVEDCLQVRVYNTGKGIKKEDIPLIFNRYRILDNVEENAVKGLSSRNGLGMAICHSMTELLKGKIEVESEVGKYAEFVVTFPQSECNQPALAEKHLGQEVNERTFLLADKEEKKKLQDEPRQKSEATILVIDDNTEILTLLEEVLSVQFHVECAHNADEGMAMLEQQMPDLIITDVMMPGTDGFALTRQIKQNKHTMHIPLIILSAKNTTDEKVEGIEAGADAYVAKPFNTRYLKSLVERMITNKNVLKQYYNSSASAYEFANGQLLHKQDKEFLDSVLEILERNMDNAEFSPENIAGELGISSRKLYRRFKEVAQVSPGDFIKEHRLAYAAKLLVTSALTVQEIIYKTGFNNRSHFYKEFYKRYQATPKEYREKSRQGEY